MNSQGGQFYSNRCPRLESQETCLGALEGRNENVPPFQGLRFDDSSPRGLCPWLLAFAPTGAEQTSAEFFTTMLATKLSAIGHSPPYKLISNRNSVDLWRCFNRADGICDGLPVGFQRTSLT